MKLRIKTGDQVKILAGKDKGKTGKVIQTFPEANRVVVEGVNAAKRHLRSRNASQPGQRVDFFMPVHASNVLPIGESGTPRRHRKAVAERRSAAPSSGKTPKRS